MSKAFLTLTSTFMNMNFTTAASIGFVAGFASAGACSGLLYAAHRFTSIRPEQVYKLAFKTLRHDPRVRWGRVPHPCIPCRSPTLARRPPPFPGRR